MFSLKRSSDKQATRAAASAGHYAEGVKHPRRSWADGFAPYARALRNLKLPRRYKDRDPRNIRRAMAVASLMHKVKLEQVKNGV